MIRIPREKGCAAGGLVLAAAMRVARVDLGWSSSGAHQVLR